MKTLSCDILILGGGPAGLAAARKLGEAKAGRILILEREGEAGGIPRHCGHWGFGFREFGRLLQGPDYARRLVDRLPGAVDLRCHWSALELRPGGRVLATGPEGMVEIAATRVLLALGARETPRSARLISGARPAGILTTGALQQAIYIEDHLPCRAPIVVGSELVAFSTLLTLRHKGVKPVALIEAGPRVTAYRACAWGARIFFNVPVLTDTELLAILGEERVEGVHIDRDGWPEEIACDGVIFTGGFRPENALLAGSPVAIDRQGDRGTFGPLIDDRWRCSDPFYFAAGNLLRGIETAGRSHAEGEAAASAILTDLAGLLPDPARILPVTAEAPLKYVYPQRLTREGADAPSPLLFQARFSKAARGRLLVFADDREIWSRRIAALPERRIAWAAPWDARRNAAGIHVRFEVA